MMLIYEIGPDMLWTGESMEIGEKDGAPRGWTRTPIPGVIPEGKVPRFVGTGWDVVDPPAPPEPTIPTSVTKRQAKLVLLGAGLLDAVEAYIAAIEGTEGRAAQIEWAEATEFRRDHPLIVSLGPVFGLSEADIDSLFVQAAQIA